MLLLFVYSFVGCSTVFGLQSWEINEKITNQAVYGDMILTPRQQLRYGDSASPVRGVYRKESLVDRWTGNIVPYSLSPQYTESQKEVVRRSLRGLEKMACFKFVERSREVDYLFVVPMDGCYSYVGKIGGRQMMSLAVDCLADYIIWHEMMHAIGFEHEHQRPDRDGYIRVEYRNVEPGQIVNFEKISTAEVDYPDSYDYKSIMHYDGMAFGRRDGGRRLATMIPLRRGIVLSDNTEMSPVDIQKLRRLGKCDASTQHKANLVAPLLPGVGGCFDGIQNCASMQQKGLCKMVFYRSTMERQCARTCGLCGTKSVEGKTEENEKISEFEKNKMRAEAPTGSGNGTCQDMKVNCSQFTTQCRLPQYERMMTTLCPVTCGFCDKLRPDGQCIDHDANCALYATNGFCSDPFYDNVRSLRCAKTCQLC